MLLLALLSNVTGDDLRNAINRKYLGTGSNHVKTDWSHKVRGVEAFDGKQRFVQREKLVILKIGDMEI